MIFSQTLSSYQLADTIETPLNESEIEKVREDYLTDPEGTLEVFDDLVRKTVFIEFSIIVEPCQAPCC